MLRVIVLSAATLLVALFASRSEKSWESPSAFFAVIWGGYLLTALVFVTDLDQILNGMMWIGFSVWVMYAGTLLIRPWTPSTEYRAPAPIPARGMRALRLLAAGAAAIGASL